MATINADQKLKDELLTIIKQQPELVTSLLDSVTKTPAKIPESFPTPDTDLLRPSQAAAYLNMHRVTLHRLSERDPSFPRKLKMGERLCYYRKSDLDAWLSEQEI